VCISTLVNVLIPFFPLVERFGRWHDKKAKRRSRLSGESDREKGKATRACCFVFMCAYNFFYNLVILSFLKDGASAFISAKGKASNEKERVAWIASICKQRDVTQVGRKRVIKRERKSIPMTRERCWGPVIERVKERVRERNSYLGMIGNHPWLNWTQRSPMARRPDGNEKAKLVKKKTRRENGRPKLVSWRGSVLESKWESFPCSVLVLGFVGHRAHKKPSRKKKFCLKNERMLLLS